MGREGDEVMKNYPSKKTKQEMFQFFMRTSIPQILKKLENQEITLEEIAGAESSDIEADAC